MGLDGKILLNPTITDINIMHSQWQKEEKTKGDKEEKIEEKIFVSSDGGCLR